MVSFLIIPTLVLAFLFVLGAFSGSASAGNRDQTSPDGVWSDASEAGIQLQGERLIVPDQYRTLALDTEALADTLAETPMEFGESPSPVVLTLPMPDGTLSAFRIVGSPIMAPELAARFPEIRTYAGRGLDNPQDTTRFDVTPNGFHAIIFSPGGTVYIDPYSRGDTRHYISYYQTDYTRDTNFVQHEPLGDNAEVEALLQTMNASGLNLPSGPELRTYRVAVAATGEYTQFHGGMVADGMAAIVTAMNRVNGIYERDVAARMELVANNDMVVYTNGATDPYTNNSGFVMLGENQANLDAVIGSPNYDIGHVFSTGGGGVAFLSVVCDNGDKAKGVTGLSSPIGDPFYVDYVSHEIGHQYGGTHTFNGTSGSCSGGNRTAATAYEPGSGTTIMAYAGICSPQNIQSNSDDHFHIKSIEQMRTHIVSGGGNSCAVITNTGNSPPNVDAGDDYTIPKSTPFILTGSASDPDGDTITYNWEQYDLGPAGHPNSPSGNAPLFRSFPSKSVPERTFPQISDILNNTQTLGEILPSYARGMTFRLTVRDNNVSPSAGGVATDQMSVSVDNDGPFLVTAPNTAVTWTGGTSENVTWDVANTDQPPVSCAEVDIHLSTDGGFTYPVLVEANVPNDGSEPVVVPNQATTQARVRVMCSDNIFFDISDTNFTIEEGAPMASLSINKQVEPAGSLSAGQAVTYTITVDNNGSLAATASITDTFPAGLENLECEGVPGDLDVTTNINPGGQASYECTAEVDPALDIELTKTVDQTSVTAGGKVTYTLAVTNPHNILTLSNVTVTDPDVSGCSPALGVPFDLGPGASQVFVCADVVINTSVTNVASVTAEFDIDNQAQASAPEDPFGIAGSGIVTSVVALGDSASAAVTAVYPYPVYIPIGIRND